MEKVPIVCPCGRPLTITKTDHQYVLAHFESFCSPMIHAPSLKDVMIRLGELLEKFGHYPTRDEFFKMTDGLPIARVEYEYEKREAGGL
jgi:hypothetical protein